jgi:hypothetical protein
VAGFWILYPSLPQHPLCVVTKARLRERDLRELDAVGQKVLLFLSQSFAPQGAGAIEQGPVAAPEDTVANMRLAAMCANVYPIHFWRPVSRRTVPDRATAQHQLSLVRDAGARASVLVGMKVGPGVLSEDLAYLNRVLEIDPAAVSGEYLDPEVVAFAMDAARALRYPPYRHTSCAVALMLRQVEALRTWALPQRASRCAPCSCPASQRARCDDDVTPIPSAAVLEWVARRAAVAESSVRWLANEGVDRDRCRDRSGSARRNHTCD